MIVDPGAAGETDKLRMGTATGITDPGYNIASSRRMGLRLDRSSNATAVFASPYIKCTLV